MGTSIILIPIIFRMGCINSKHMDTDIQQESRNDSNDNRLKTDSHSSNLEDREVCFDERRLNRTLEDRDISQVTEIVSAKNRFRFSIEYLGIGPNEYHTIESEAQFIHHDTLFECIRRWKNRTEAEGNNACKTGLVKQVIHMCISRTTLKTMGKTASRVENLHELLVKLGKLAWTALTRGSKQLLIYKVRQTEAIPLYVCTFMPHLKDLSLVLQW